jgi:hypothetical protein
MKIVRPGTLRRLRSFAAPALFVFAATEGCQLLSGLSDLEVKPSALACEPGSVQSCYTGPEGTQDVGVCMAGSQTCEPDGSAWGPCSGEVMPDPGPENCASGVDSNCDNQAMCTGTFLWGYSASGTTKFVAHSIAVDSAGDVVIVGVLAGTASLGDKMIPSDVDMKGDAFVAKLNPEGAVQWVKTYGAEGDDAAIGVAIGADDAIVVVGRFSTSMDFGAGMGLVGAGLAGTDMFVAKLDKGGAPMWAKSFGDGEAQALHGVAVAPDDSVVVSGWFAGSIDLGKGAIGPASVTDGVVVKLSPSGAPLWSATIVSGGLDEGYSVAVDSAGDVVVGGRVNGAVNFNNKDVMGNGANGAFVGKLSGFDGAPVWGQVFGAPSAANGQLVIDVASAPSAGEVVVVGHFETDIQFPPDKVLAAGASLNIFIAKLNQNGDAIWSKAFGGDGVDVAHEVAVDSFGNITVVGGFDVALDVGPPAKPITSLGKADGFAVKLDPEGRVLWAQGMRGPGVDAGYGAAVDALGATYITGVAGPLVIIAGEIAGEPLPGSSEMSIFFAKLSP